MGKLQLDDYFVAFAWSLLLATAIIWSTTLEEIYYMKHIYSSGIRITPENSPRLFTAIRTHLDATISMLVMFYIGLWSIKINFLIFFRRLGYRITYYRVYWWIVAIVTGLAGIACISDLQYACVVVTVQESLETCSTPKIEKFEKDTLIINCVLDVFTDVLSKNYLPNIWKHGAGCLTSSVVLSLPISIVWNIRISLMRKVQLAGLFSLVLVTIVISIVRVAVGASNNNESTWLNLWHFIEFATGT
jgi:hypothetical protein